MGFVLWFVVLSSSLLDLFRCWLVNPATISFS